ncbi:hypothetical protein QR98_0094360 [Sarcoptes scabiei]|uniref:Peptidase S1 domain-containing protein n=1 Tax=Sarcoptes scabiei TaxID=52283 RepID=A0A132AIR3_SARSC|nr:hypothetical protein QR98_0094360 [Sarcoptes scabiei]
MMIETDQDTKFRWTVELTPNDLYETIWMARLKILFNFLLNIKKISQEQCVKIFQNDNIKLSNDILCYEPINPIRFQQNLIGGPLVEIDNGRPFIKGVLSYGIDKNETPIVYTPIRWMLKEWINSQSKINLND